MPNINIAARNANVNRSTAKYNSGNAKLYTGTRPAPDAAATGTLLVTIALPATAFAAAANGVAAKAGTWEANAVATGTAGWLRLTSADATETSDYQIGVDATMADTSVVSGNPVRIETATYSQAGS